MCQSRAALTHFCTLAHGCVRVARLDDQTHCCLYVWVRMEKPLGEGRLISLTPRLPPSYSPHPSSAETAGVSVRLRLGLSVDRRRPAAELLACSNHDVGCCAISARDQGVRMACRICRTIFFLITGTPAHLTSWLALFCFVPLHCIALHCVTTTTLRLATHPVTHHLTTHTACRSSCRKASG